MKFSHDQVRIWREKADKKCGPNDSVGMQMKEDLVTEIEQHFKNNYKQPEKGFIKRGEDLKIADLTIIWNNMAVISKLMDRGSCIAS
jgi:hypothetical protein